MVGTEASGGRGHPRLSKQYAHTKSGAGLGLPSRSRNHRAPERSCARLAQTANSLRRATWALAIFTALLVVVTLFPLALQAWEQMTNNQLLYLIAVIVIGVPIVHLLWDHHAEVIGALLGLIGVYLFVNWMQQRFGSHTAGVVLIVLAAIAWGIHFCGSD